MKTIDVKSIGGEHLTCEQLATFAAYVQHTQFRFLVLRMPDGEISLTHRNSGKRVATLRRLTLPHEYVAAGKRALQSVVDSFGATRVHEVLTFESKGED